MTHKGESCYSVTRAELLDAMRGGAVLWWWKFGPMVGVPMTAGTTWPVNELHPRRDTVMRLIERGVLVKSHDANEVQRQCGMATYRLAALPNVEGR